MPIEKWRKLSEETIFEHPRLTLIEDTVLLPNGQQTRYLRYKRTGHVATIIAIRDDGFILLQREYSHPPNEILLEFPGGGVPNDEDIAVGANRELMEECSLRGDMELIGSYYSENRRSDSKMHVFVATNLQEADLPADDEEFLEHDWYSEEAIDAMIANGQIKHAHVLASWTLYKSWRMKNEGND
jgi:ADP-ribose pyrophosphatase